MGFFNTCTHCLLLIQYIEIVTYVRSGDGAVIKDVNDTHNMVSYFLKAFNIRLESANWRSKGQMCDTCAIDLLLKQTPNPILSMNDAPGRQMHTQQRA